MDASGRWRLARRWLWEPGWTRGFQLWIALPPELELGASESVYLAPEFIPHDGPARVLLGTYGTATSSIKAPSPMNYLAVRLRAGARWSYQPPAEHNVLWTAIGMGSVLVPDELQQGELVAFRPSGGTLLGSRLNPTQSLWSARLPHMITSLFSAPTPSTQTPRRFVKPRRGFPRSGHASFNRAGFDRARCQDMAPQGRQSGLRFQLNRNW